MPPPAFTLKSPQTGTDYHVYLHAADAAAAAEPLPAVLFTDGDDQFRFAVDAYRTARAAGEVPALFG